MVDKRLQARRSPTHSSDHDATGLLFRACPGRRPQSPHYSRNLFTAPLAGRCEVQSAMTERIARDAL